jgi:hypothetical protein
MWSQHDNPHYRGKIDRQYVARTEHWEADYFIMEYVNRRGGAATQANYKIVADMMEKCPLRAPITRVALNKWLDEHITS